MKERDQVSSPPNNSDVQILCRDCRVAPPSSLETRPRIKTVCSKLILDCRNSRQIEIAAELGRTDTCEINLDYVIYCKFM